MGSLCRKACVFKVLPTDPSQAPDQGYGCNTTDPNGGVSDCPPGMGKWAECAPFMNPLASLGLCVGM
jgi:hypothetical protein